MNSEAGSDASGRQRSLAGRVETLLMCVLLLGIVSLAAAQILLRLFFSYSLFWANDLIGMAVLWLAVIGAVEASREGKHIAIGVVPRYFPRSWIKPAAVSSMLFAALVTGVLGWQAFRFVVNTKRFQDMFIADLPAWWFQTILPIGFALMCYRFLGHAVAVLRERK